MECRSLLPPLVVREEFEKRLEQDVDQRQKDTLKEHIGLTPEFQVCLFCVILVKRVERVFVLVDPHLIVGQDHKYADCAEQHQNVRQNPSKQPFNPMSLQVLPLNVFWITNSLELELKTIELERLVNLPTYLTNRFKSFDY